MCTEHGAAKVGAASFQVIPAIVALAIATVVYFVGRKVAKTVVRAMATLTA